MIEAVEQSQVNQMNLMGDAMMGMMSVDVSDSVYQSFRSKTTLGLEVTSLVAGGYGAIKGMIGFSKLARMPAKMSKLSFLMQTTGTESSAASSLNSLRLKNRLISQEISYGHAFEKHVLNQGEFSGLVRTRTQFAQHIENVLNDFSGIKELKNGRVAYWHQETGTVVIRNSTALDGGTAFQPVEGINYFDTRIR